MKVPNWYVVTGGPDSGKTTTVEYLSKLGYHTVAEYARLLIDKELAKGKTIEEIRKNRKKFQDNALELKLELEKKTPKDRTVFLDRGVPDTLAYYRFLKLKVPKRLFVIGKNRYKKVFLLDILTYKKDYARIESKKEAEEIHRQIKKAYKELGYGILRIPVMSVENRVKMILKNIKH